MKKKYIILISLCFFAGFFIFIKYKSSIDDKNNVGEIFNQIYIKGKWGKNESGMGHSGHGSKVENAKKYIVFINRFLTEHNIKTVVDAGCGDWQFSKYIIWDEINYLGIDISSIVINRISKKYTRENIKFQLGDITKELPGADLLICKDVLQHLSNKQIITFINNNLKTNRYKWVIITNDKTQSGKNIDIIPGKYRRLDLSKPPFNIKGLVDIKDLFEIKENKTVQVLKLYK